MKFRYLLFLTTAFSFIWVGCQDLTVDNENNPDRTRALASPQDVEKLVSDTFTRYWSANQYSSTSMPWSTIADEISSSWANWGMRDMSEEPRRSWNNDPSYSRQEMTEDPWFRSYTCISDAADGINSVTGNEARFTDEGIDPIRLVAFAKFNMGLCLGNLALRFDKAFIVDENTDLEAVALGQVELTLESYDLVAEAAIAKLEEAIDVSRSASFTITAEDDWIYGNVVTSARLIRLANSFIARIMASVPRSPEERAAANWSGIMSKVDNGITEDFIPIGDDNGDVREWDSMKFYGQNYTTWARADYRTIGPADEGSGYQNWLNTPVADRNIFDIETSDRRISGPDGPQSNGKYFRYVGKAGPFPSARGTYHYSSHTPMRYVDYLNDNANGEMTHMVLAEMDLFKAEGLLRTGGSTQMVADLINKTRVANGELPPATGSDAVGSPNDGSWKNTGIHLAGASLWAKLQHEFRIETFATTGGLAWETDRGWGALVQGTPVHFPVPGKELETLALQQYTFGGVGGTGAAPKRGPNGRTSEVYAIDDRDVRPR